MIEVFRWHAKTHPAMQPQDALKLSYQSAFGAEHLLKNADYAAKMLFDELDGCEARDEVLLEPLSDVSCRLNLRAWKQLGLSKEWLLRMFVRSARIAEDGEARFFAALRAVDALCQAGEMPFSAADWQQAKQAYLKEGLHAVHHSEAYRETERPAYRLVSLRMARLLPLLRQVKTPCTIALDGRAASGKTTLAADFAAVTGAGVIHMDDFFLPPELRAKERLQTPGGNVHYERFKTDVLPHLQKSADFQYPRFDCSVMHLRGERAVQGSDIYIVEGAYSCHPALGEYMQVRAFCDVDAKTQRARILARDGEKMLERFEQSWIPLEENYIKCCNIKEKASVIL